MDEYSFRNKEMIQSAWQIDTRKFSTTKGVDYI